MKGFERRKTCKKKYHNNKFPEHFSRTFDDETCGKLTVNAACCCTSVTKINSFFGGFVTTIIAAQLNKILAKEELLASIV